MSFYAELNSSLDAILGQYTVSRMFRRPDGVPVRFGAFAVANDFFAHGLFKIVESLPPLTNDEEYGDQTVSGDQGTMIATVSRLIIPKTTQTKINEIEQTFNIESEAARGSLTDAEINSYEGMWAEVQARHGDPGAPTDQIQAFATEMGITPANAVTLIRDKLRPYKLGISTALAKREKALIALP